ncbi:hypothetical protein G9A89_007751 [Geosiphon pyriformis]|nr:hypothetical protein G9A89_007751 [Geosiphon pyriformis]
MPPHFYLRLVPKYGVIDKGSTGIREHYKPATFEQVKEINKAFSPNKNGIIAEKSKVIAKLHNDKFPGYAVILKELMKKYETKINCHNFFIGCNLGQVGKLVEQEKGEAQQQARNLYQELVQLKEELAAVRQQAKQTEKQLTNTEQKVI